MLLAPLVATEILAMLSVWTAAAVQPEKIDARVSLRKGMRQLEQQLQDDGFKCVVGVDEAGRGPLVRRICVE